MVNGVLVERTVKEVIPAVRTNSDGLKKILEELVKQYKKQQDEMEKWKVRHFCIERPPTVNLDQGRPDGPEIKALEGTC